MINAIKAFSATISGTYVELVLLLRDDFKK